MLGGVDTNCVALSEPMFVHNNSKYRSEVRPVTTKPPRLLRVDQDSKSKSVLIKTHYCQCNILNYP